MERKVFMSFKFWETKMPPKEITRQTGIIPDTELLKGEKNAERILPRQNLWSFRSTVFTNNIEDHWKELENKLNPAKSKIKNIAKDGTVSITIVITTQGYIPDITIPFEMLDFMGYVDGLIDIDHLQ